MVLLSTYLRKSYSSRFPLPCFPHKKAYHDTGSDIPRMPKGGIVSLLGAVRRLNNLLSAIISLQPTDLHETPLRSSLHPNMVDKPPISQSQMAEIQEPECEKRGQPDSISPFSELPTKTSRARSPSSSRWRPAEEECTQPGIWKTATVVLAILSLILLFTLGGKQFLSMILRNTRCVNTGNESTNGVSSTTKGLGMELQACREDLTVYEDTVDRMTS